MEKEVLYIERDDDITDVILAISNSEAKIIAIIPPKDGDIFQDLNNVKLIHKTSLKTKKNLVLVTTDPIIINHAAIMQVPVTKDLKSAPAIPKLTEKPVQPAAPADPFKKPKISIKDTTNLTANTADLADEPEAEPDTPKLHKKFNLPFLHKFKKSTQATNDQITVKLGDVSPDEVNDNLVLADENPENSNDAEPALFKTNDTHDQPSTSDDQSDKTDITSIYRNSERAERRAKQSTNQNVFLAWLQDHARLLTASAAIIIILVIAGFWLFIISPAVKITVHLRTSTSNFAEVVSFTTEEAKEDLAEGAFSLIKHSIENETKVEFEATGQKNVGNKATGSVVVSKNMGTATNPITSFEVPASTTFTHSNKAFTSNTTETLTWDGATLSECSNHDTASITNGCVIEKTIAVTATEPGTAYNIAAAATGWTSSKSGISVKSTANFTGGTDDIKTIVTQKDINDARTKAKVSVSADADMKAKLKLEIPESEELIIDASFSQYAEEPVSSVAVGEEPKAGEKPTLTFKNIALIYTIDLGKVKQFITTKAKVAENNYIYGLGNPFIENFIATNEEKTAFTGKLKTSYTVGVNLTEQYIIDNVKGKLIGEIKPFLTSAGANRVDIETSHSLVNTVPNDVNKISVEIITD